MTAEKKSGKAALNTFAELAAFFKTKDEPAKPVAETKPEAPTSAPEPPAIDTPPAS